MNKDMTKLINISISQLQERVIEKPIYMEWEYPSEFGGGKAGYQSCKLNYDGLNDYEKMILFIFAWNLSDICPFRRTIMKEFSWSKYKVSKMFSELKKEGLESVATFSESTGLISGRGYRYYYN